ncbi:MAG: L-histidine N(alpha)-methyltransferase, partial [Oceanococcaceae bacterium]
MTDNTARSLVAEDLPLREEIVRGLNGSPPALPSRLFYDDRGARLFERICTLPEYYPTRCELEILARALPEIAANLGPGCEVIEPGSGEGIKTRRLLAALDAPRLYQPLDVAAEQLREAAARLRTHFPALTVVPVVADFTKPLHLPAAVGRRVFFFPGSTIGNFPPQMAEELLASWHADAGPEGQLLIGVDLRKDPQVLHAAYNDAAGVTAAFNRNIL